MNMKFKLFTIFLVIFIALSMKTSSQETSCEFEEYIAERIEDVQRIQKDINALSERLSPDSTGFIETQVLMYANLVSERELDDCLIEIDRLFQEYISTSIMVTFLISNVNSENSEVYTVMIRAIGERRTEIEAGIMTEIEILND